MEETNNKTINLEIEQASINSFLACLGIGLLQSIKDGKIPAKVGIWTLGIPRFLSPLEKSKNIAPQILNVFRQGDELSALEQLAPTEFVSILEEQITILQEILSTEDNFWAVDWRNSQLHD